MDGVFRDRVRERDLDNFLVEELHASETFLDWMLGRLEHAMDVPVGPASVQKSPPRERDRRQTDVRIGWMDSLQDLRACVLIESKVTADFEPGQAEAYASERSALRVRLGMRNAASLLVAPRAKLASLRHDGAFDAEIAIEEIVALLAKRRQAGLERELDARLEARIQLLEALCGKRSGADWIGNTIEEKRTFAEAYAVLAAEMLPELRVRPSTDGRKAITRSFDGPDLPSLPGAWLRHEFGPGQPAKYANVLLRGAADRMDAVRNSGLLDATSYTAERAGQSLGIRVRTPSVDPMQPFKVQREAVEAGLEEIGGLIDWLKENQEALARLVGADHAPRPASRPRNSR